MIISSSFYIGCVEFLFLLRFCPQISISQYNITLLLRPRLGNIPSMLIILRDNVVRTISNVMNWICSTNISRCRKVQICHYAVPHLITVLFSNTQCTLPCVCRDCWSVFNARPKLFPTPLSYKPSLRTVHLFRYSIEKLVRRAIFGRCMIKCLVADYQPYPTGRSLIVRIIIVLFIEAL